jgi:hypothetical protein
MYYYLIFTYFFAVLQIASALPLYNRSVHLSESLTGFDAVQVSTPLLKTRLAASLLELGPSTPLSSMLSSTTPSTDTTGTGGYDGSQATGHILTGMRRRRDMSW